MSEPSGATITFRARCFRIARSTRTLRERLAKPGAKIVRHGQPITFQMAEVMAPRALFQQIINAIAALRPLPAVPC